MRLTSLELQRVLSCCVLCTRPAVVVGVFCPATDQMRQAVLLLRQRAIVADKVAGLAYGLCEHHLPNERTAERVEAVLLALASKVVVH